MQSWERVLARTISVAWKNKQTGISLMGRNIISKALPKPICKHKSNYCFSQRVV